MPQRALGTLSSSVAPPHLPQFCQHRNSSSQRDHWLEASNIPGLPLVTKLNSSTAAATTQKPGFFPLQKTSWHDVASPHSPDHQWVEITMIVWGVSLPWELQICLCQGRQH